ncbi:MAG: LacI family DNA-binding transcriptional regulator [Clostridiaceae bacterium]|nr:LacI family DNA-binding transcriptional regulator [Clostridiaceae bacterium]
MLESNDKKIRIIDIADELGVSTATVSNVINGKTKKLSEATYKKVQRALEERNYIPNMAAVLLSQNSSKIICIVISDHQKYEGNVLKDPFVSSLIANLSDKIEEKNYFTMIKKSNDINEIIKYASMWNMAGLVLIGFCHQDYNELRDKIRIPFVVMDGFFEPNERCANISIDDFLGGYKMGSYLIENGHKNIMYISDNNLCMDNRRYLGLKAAFKDNNLNEENIKLNIIPIKKSERFEKYKLLKQKLISITAIFCASDAYAIEIMNYLIDCGYKIPDEISIAGFDDIPEASIVRPTLTTIHQDIKLRAEMAMKLLCDEIDKDVKVNSIILPVTLVERKSVKNIKNNISKGSVLDYV